ncbi:MAG: hypothetical protein ACKO54_20170 [Alphaproteobacteria bacterium]
MSETLVPSWLKRAQPGNDVALALGVALLLVVLVVPLPVLLLDLGLAISDTRFSQPWPMPASAQGWAAP